MSNKPSGYYKLKRGWMTHPFWGRDPYCKRAAWIWLIEEAAFARRQATVNARQITLERGQLCASIRFMASAWRWEPTKVRRFLKKLKDGSAITTRNATGDASLPDVITICNYDVYQTALDDTTSRKATNSKTEAPQTIKNNNSLSKDKGDKSPPDDLDKVLYERGKALLGKSAGGQITKLKLAKGIAGALEVIEAAAKKENPAEYVAGALRNNKGHTSVDSDYGAAAGSDADRQRKLDWGWD